MACAAAAVPTHAESVSLLKAQRYYHVFKPLIGPSLCLQTGDMLKVRASLRHYAVIISPSCITFRGGKWK